MILMIDLGSIIPRLKRIRHGDYILPLTARDGSLHVGDRIAVYSSNFRRLRATGTILKTDGLRILVDWDTSNDILSKIMKTVQQFFSQFKLSTHALASLIVLLIVGDKEIPVFHQFWTSLFLMLPKMVQEGVESAAMLGLLYFASRKGLSINQFTTGVNLSALGQQNAQNAQQKQDPASK